MKKLNEKGFAISAVLYTMLILMILLMFLILAILDNGRTTANKLSSEVKEEIDNKVYNKPIEVVSNSLYQKDSKQNYKYILQKNGQLTLDDALWSNDTVSSNIKTTIDNWYVNTAKLQNYSSFLEDTIWCNDRNIIDGILLSNSAVSDDSIQVSTYNSWRNVSNGQPSFSCLNARDSYNVAGGLGNGRLEYPVGLLTADEIMYAGGTTNGANNTYYLYTANNDIATMTPSKSTGGRFLNTHSHWSSANIAYIDVNGRISGGGIYEVKKDDFRQDDPRSETTVGKSDDR